MRQSPYDAPPVGDEVSLLRTILDNPDHDTPRLVYADYLEEQGHVSQADLIRYEVSRVLPPLSPIEELEWMALQAFSDSPPSPPPDYARVQELLRAAGRRPWDGLSVSEYASDVWVRGFIQQVRGTTADWAAHGRSLVERHPIRWVHFALAHPWGKYVPGSWAWVSPRAAAEAPSSARLPAGSILPEPLWRLLPWDRKEGPGDAVAFLFDAPALAFDALKCALSQFTPKVQFEFEAEHQATGKLQRRGS